MKIAILKTGPHKSGLFSLDEVGLDALVKNSTLPMPFRDRAGRSLGWVTKLWREGDTVYGEVEGLVVSASVRPAGMKISEVRCLPRSADDRGDEGRM